MIKLENVSKSYVKNKKVIDGLDLEIKPGEIFGFLGPNGAGKTTTIKMMTGILNIDDGNIKIEGYDIKKSPIDAKRNFAYIPDNPDLFLKLKGIEYLNFIADIYQVSKDLRKERIEKCAKEFEIYDALSSKIQSYSHGMRQKIILLGMLVNDPKNWILDEPLTGLDPKSAYVLKNKMREHADSNGTVFFSTHVLDVAEKICDRVGIINNGKLIFVGNYEEMQKEFKHKDTLEKMFLEITNES